MAKPLKVKKISPTDQIDKAAIRILRTRIREFYSHWPDPEDAVTPEQLHNMRISGKRLRYSAENLGQFYPDHLAFLIDLLKRSQNLLSEIQDCVTQRQMIEEDLNRMKRRAPESKELAALEQIMARYDQRGSELFIKFREIWQAMAMKKFRDCLKAMV